MRSSLRTFSPRSLAKPWLVLSCALSAGTGCAPAQVPYRTPDHWQKTGYEWPPGSFAETGAEKETSRSAAQGAKTDHDSFAHEDAPVNAPSPSRSSSKTLGPIFTPDPIYAPTQMGEACLRELKGKGVKFVPLTELKGVENPIEIKSEVGGVRFWANDGRPFQMDCRLALALTQLEPVFRRHGLKRARYSGAYSYRQTRTGRLSHHASGLAIDLHDLEFSQRILSVSGDFAKNVGCESGIPELNSLFCDMRAARLFEEFLTPDYNYDHRDHLHISVPRKK